MEDDRVSTPTECRYHSCRPGGGACRPSDRASFCGGAARLQPPRLFAAPTEAAAEYMKLEFSIYMGLQKDDQLSYLLDTARTRGGKVSSQANATL